jgi:hypothetical protein
LVVKLIPHAMGLLLLLLQLLGYLLLAKRYK